jgi:hypothetical protein
MKERFRRKLKKNNADAVKHQRTLAAKKEGAQVAGGVATDGTTDGSDSDIPLTEADVESGGGTTNNASSDGSTDAAPTYIEETEKNLCIGVYEGSQRTNKAVDAMLLQPNSVEAENQVQNPNGGIYQTQTLLFEKPDESKNKDDGESKRPKGPQLSDDQDVEANERRRIAEAIESATEPIFGVFDGYAGFVIETTVYYAVLMMSLFTGFVFADKLMVVCGRGLEKATKGKSANGGSGEGKESERKESEGLEKDAPKDAAEKKAQ